MDIHFLDWFIWFVCSLLFLFLTEEDEPLEGCGKVVIWAMVSIVYTIIFYHHNWSDLIIYFWNNINIKL